MNNEATGIVDIDEDLTEVVEPTEVGEEAETFQEVVVNSGADYTAVLNSIDVKLTFMIVVLILALAWFCFKKLVQYLDMFFK